MVGAAVGRAGRDDQFRDESEDDGRDQGPGRTAVQCCGSGSGRWVGLWPNGPIVIIVLLVSLPEPCVRHVMAHADRELLPQGPCRGTLTCPPRMVPCPDSLAHR